MPRLTVEDRTFHEPVPVTVEPSKKTGHSEAVTSAASKTHHSFQPDIFKCFSLSSFALNFTFVSCTRLQTQL